MSRESYEMFTFKVIFVLSELGDSLLIRNQSAYGETLGAWSPRSGLSTTESGRWMAADRQIEHRLVHRCVKLWTEERDRLESVAHRRGERSKS